MPVRLVQQEDLPQLKSIFEEWVRDDSGKVLALIVADKLGRIERNIGNESESYFVAVDESGRVLGGIGLETIGEEMRPYVQTSKPREVTNAFVTASSRRQGTGGQLIDYAEHYAKNRGVTELVITSHPVYRQTSWEIYDKRFDRVKDGIGGASPLWRKEL